MISKLAVVAALMIAVLASCSGWFFTLIVDWSMLTLMGYTVSFFTYRIIVWAVRKTKNESVKSWARTVGVIVIFLLPLTLLSLYAGGILPYFGLLEPEQVYFGLVPSEWLGASGNDFMWNGLILPITGRVVPLEVQPTSNKFWFNVFACSIWLGMPIILASASLYGYARSLMDRSKSWIKAFLPGFVKVSLLALAELIFLMSIARFLVWIYS